MMTGPRKDSRGRWLKGGGSANPAGRPKGFAEFRAAAMEKGEEALATICRIMRTSKSDALKLECAREILDRGFGRPVAAIGIDMSVHGGDAPDFSRLSDAELRIARAIAAKAAGEPAMIEARPAVEPVGTLWDDTDEPRLL